MVEQDKNQISEQEAELYDRQIRWVKKNIMLSIIWKICLSLQYLIKDTTVVFLVWDFKF
jgi:hypothetical protein